MKKILIGLIMICLGAFLWLNGIIGPLLVSNFDMKNNIIIRGGGFVILIAGVFILGSKFKKWVEG